MDFDVMKVIYHLAVILLATKLFGLLMRKIGLPQVAGMVIAGLLIGPAIFGQLDLGSFHGILNPTDNEMNVLKTFSQIGVILILFSSGLETDIKELKRSGLAATLIAVAGVLVPLILGTCGAMLFMGGFSGFSDSNKLMNALFIGCILSATSVGITVETLRELGKLNTPVGVTVISAAIIDDVLGIIVLSVITGLNGDGSIGMTLLKALGFFAFTIGVGLILRQLFKYVQIHHPHTRRLGIYALAMCFLFAFCAEEFFGIAAITGAFMAGLMLSDLGDANYVDRKIIVSGYMIFTPIFFAFIGISADFSHFRPSDLVFGLVFVLLGILGKIIGCSFVARLCRYSPKDSMTIGTGMIARGEVALAVYATGSCLIYFDKSSGALLGINPLVGTIMLIICTSIICPILLKLIFRKEKR